VGIACWAGLLAGLFESVVILVRVEFTQNGLFRTNPQILWMAPTANLLLFGVVGLLLALIIRPLPRVGRGVAAWVLGVLTLLSPLLAIRVLDAIAGLILAIGLASWLVGAVARRPAMLRRMIVLTTPFLLAAVLLLSVFAGGRDSYAHRPSAPKVAAPANSPNVLLIVMDTVRADAMSWHDSARGTTPNLQRIATQGVRFDRAMSTAPWTLASHASFFTGRWTWELLVGPDQALDTRYPTLAEYLGEHGYATAGFAANTVFCSREYGLARGFEHYEDFDLMAEADQDLILTPLAFARSCALGSLVCQAAGAILDRAKPDDGSGLTAAPPLESRRKDALHINDSVLRWVAKHKDRPFFAFVNYFDVHDPYLLPVAAGDAGNAVRYSRQERSVLQDWISVNMKSPTAAEMALARGAYDTCMRYLDEQIGRLLHDLDRMGRLQNTVVVITSDHGEHFGEHQVHDHPLLGHRQSVYQAEVHVPLLILAPSRVVPGTVVSEPVSLRDLPATILDLLDMTPGSPFPGRSLVDDSGRAGEESDPTFESAVMAEFESRYDLHLAKRFLSDTPGLHRVVVADRWAYHRDGDGSEELYDLASDPDEQHDLSTTEAAREVLPRLQRTLRKLVTPEQPGRQDGGL
jgi:arylsulfatase A-like enzyme